MEDYTIIEILLVEDNDEDANLTIRELKISDLYIHAKLGKIFKPMTTGGQSKDSSKP